jgi:hypothetical protein
MEFYTHRTQCASHDLIISLRSDGIPTHPPVASSHHQYHRRNERNNPIILINNRGDGIPKSALSSPASTA